MDWKIREVWGRERFGHRKPFVLGCDVIRVVESAGSEVKRFETGDAVYGYVNLIRCGAYSEFALITEAAGSVFLRRPAAGGRA